ncbi:MAG: helix-turn-helix transcriptional regulator [Micromonosporaceae bacterium]|nr:helix-turn-helix transcriptional regulator [Micromonosporaceae bacterium]
MARSRAPIGDNLARLRRQRELTQEGLAERAGVSVDLVKKLEQHQRDSARLSTLEALASALDVALSELTSTTLGGLQPVPAAASTNSPSFTGFRMTQRRATIERMNADDLDEIRRTIAHLVELDTLHGSAGLEGLALRAFSEARGRLAVSRCPATLAAELAEGVAELGQVAAWLLHDSDRHHSAKATLAEALTIVTTSGGPRRVELMIVDQLSMLAERSGAWAEALRLADRGFALAGTSSPRLEALCRIRRGRALARGGNPDGLAELRRAAAMLDDGVRDDDPPWAWWITPAEVAIHRALAASDVGEHRHAIHHAQTAVAELHPHQRRDQAVFRVALLRVAVAAEAWPDTIAVAADLAHLLPIAGSARTVARLQATTDRLPDTAPAAVAQALDSTLAATGTVCPPTSVPSPTSEDTLSLFDR